MTRIRAIRCRSMTTALTWRCRGAMEFADVETLVTYLALVPWDAPKSSFEEHVSRLRSLREDLPIRVTQRKFRIYATKL